MEISQFFEPIDGLDFQYAGEGPGHIRMGDLIQSYTRLGQFPEFQTADIAIFGVMEERNAVNNEGCALAPDFIRQKLYSLFPGTFKPNVVDLGNIKQGFTLSDTYFAVSSVAGELLEHGIIPLILGGSQDITFANYQAYQNLGQIINIVSIDSMFDIGKAENELDAKSYLSSIILHQPNYLFNYANIGYQTYFVDQEALALMKNLMFDTHRLGVVRQNIENAEPLIRNADLVSIDVSAIRASDAPGNGNASPNGFYGEEACLFTRYAGLSDKLTSIGFYETNPRHDKTGQTAQLVAQMIWYFIDGFYNRFKDFPFKNDEDYSKYRVSISDHKEELVFYKSKKSDRWWMEIPLKSEHKIKFQRHYLVPCSYNDYQVACNNDIPDRWWMVYQKLM
jgi:arginase family enzyme